MTEGPMFPNQFGDVEPIRESVELTGPDPVMVNISGLDDQPLWVQTWEVAAVGVRGQEDTLVVLRGSGMQLVAKSIHPNQVVQLLCDSTVLPVNKDWSEDKPWHVPLDK